VSVECEECPLSIILVTLPAWKVNSDRIRVSFNLANNLIGAFVADLNQPFVIQESLSFAENHASIAKFSTQNYLMDVCYREFGLNGGLVSSDSEAWVWR
jgi:hypothetical protein